MATRPRKPKDANPSNLLAALQFIAVAQHSEGTPMQTHCRIGNGSVIGFDGGLTAGHKIEESLNICPHTNTLIAALSKCKESISITQLDSGKLSVKSGKFRALVPCLPYEDLPAVEPDTPCTTLTDAIKTALAACVPLTEHGGNEAFTSAVLLQAETAVATNRHVIIEAWHGIDLPPGLLLPKASVNAILKSQKPLSHFGFSMNSATFYFEDGSFIKTQLFCEQFPDYKRVLDIPSQPYPMIPGFYSALDDIAPFAEKIAYFRNGKICSHVKDDEGASYEVEGLPDNLAFNIEYLRIIRSHAHSIQFNASELGKTVFFGENVRGAIMPLGIKKYGY